MLRLLRLATIASTTNNNTCTGTAITTTIAPVDASSIILKSLIINHLYLSNKLSF